MPAGKIKESLWLGTARIFLSSARGQGGVRQLDGALGGLWGLGWPPKPKRPRVQVPAESNQGEIWECHSCSQQPCSVAQLLSPSFSDSLLSHFSLLLRLFPLLLLSLFFDRCTHTYTQKKPLHTLNMKPEVHVCWYVYVCVSVCMCVGACTRAVFVTKLMCVHVCAGMCLQVWACVRGVTEKTKGIKNNNSDPVRFDHSESCPATIYVRLTAEPEHICESAWLCLLLLYFTSVCVCVYFEVHST